MSITGKTQYTEDVPQLKGKLRKIPETDDTLTKKGYAADAKATGDLLREVRGEMAYPVGSIYLSVIDNDPATIFGGVWERIEDCFLLACGSKYAAGEKGGESDVALTEEELPPHEHQQTYLIQNNIDSDRTDTDVFLGATPTENYGIIRSLNITGGGGGETHNNMPPYLAVYAWLRKE